MELIDIATEQTTAVTDLILAVLAFVSAYLVKRKLDRDRSRAKFWLGAFGLLGVAALLGAIAHGFKMSFETNVLIWHPINLSLGMAIALFVVVVVYDIWGNNAASKALPGMILIAALFFAATIIWTDIFLVFIVYEALAMLFALSGYLWLSVGKGNKGHGWLASGVFVTILAAAVQASHSVHINFIWQFDHNGVYHLIQMVAILLLLIGVIKTNIKLATV